MAPSAGSKEVVLMCTGLEEKKQNELYLMAKGMEKTQMLRDKVAAGMYDVRTSHLVVGPSFGRTDKLLCALAAGIPIVHEDYVKKSHKQGVWLKEVGSYDVGRQTEQPGNRFVIPIQPLIFFPLLIKGCSSLHWQRGKQKRRKEVCSRDGLWWCF